MTTENFVKDLEKINPNDNPLLSGLLKSTVRNALVEKFNEGNERPCHKNDFTESLKNRERLTSELKTLIESFVKKYFSDIYNESETKYPDFDNEILALVLILCGQNNSLQPWNSNSIVDNCQIILSQILKLFNYSNLTELFSRSYKINLIKTILQTLTADLTVSTWKYFPASVICYKWVLGLISQSDFSQHLNLILPPALLLIDDYVSENRIIGAECLNLIIQNITIAELQLCGHGEVIYSALMPLLRLREADIIYSALPPLIALTKKLEFNLGKKQPTKWSKFDNIMEIFLENMELEQALDLRNCYISNLSLLISALAYGTVRWSKRLLRIFDDYIQTAGKYYQEKTLNHCLKAVDIYIEFSKDVAFLHKKHLLFSLMIALHFLSTFNENKSNESLKITINCMTRLLESVSEAEKENLKEDFKQNFYDSGNFQQFCDHLFKIL